MNLANQITVARLFLAAILFVLLETACAGAEGGVWWYVAFVLYLVTVISDGIDGYVARSRGEVTAFGRIADPFADKIVICGVLVITHHLKATRDLVPTWIVLVILAREFLVSGLRGYLESQGTRFGARWEGKTKLIVQAVYCGSVLLHPALEWPIVGWVARITLWATLVITLFSLYSYVREATRLISKAAEV